MQKKWFTPIALLMVPALGSIASAGTIGTNPTFMLNQGSLDITVTSLYFQYTRSGDSATLYMDGLPNYPGIGIQSVMNPEDQAQQFLFEAEISGLNSMTPLLTVQRFDLFEYGTTTPIFHGTDSTLLRWAWDETAISLEFSLGSPGSTFAFYSGFKPSDLPAGGFTIYADEIAIEGQQADVFVVGPSTPLPSAAGAAAVPLASLMLRRRRDELCDR